MKMFIHGLRRNLSEDFYNLMLMLILSAGILVVLQTMMPQGPVSFPNLQNISHGSYLY